MQKMSKKVLVAFAGGACAFLLIVFTLAKFPRAIMIGNADSANATNTAGATGTATPTGTPGTALAPVYPPLDQAAYDAKLLQLANLTTIQHIQRIRATSSTPSSTIITTSTIPVGWPVKTVYPNGGAILPFRRIVAYYGNFYSAQMGVLGEYPPAQVLQMLASTSALWQAADTSTPTLPAIEYIAVTAQASAGTDGKYRARMPDSQIQKAIQMAAQANGIVILDVQVGLSNVQTEIPLLEKYLKLPQVHLALDPEFAMHGGARPGTVIGSLDAADINFVAQYLANLVRQNNLPPKVLVVHRFTQAMVTNSAKIIRLPEVQIVMNMDGFGSISKKITSYHDFVQAYPVQFTGIKLFYKNDARAGHLMTPAEVFKLAPQPIYVQYQ